MSIDRTIKGFLTGVLAIILFVAVASPVAVVAQEAETDSVSSVPQEQDDDGADFRDRLEANKQRVIEIISVERENRIIERCTAAQTKLTEIEKRYAVASEKRINAYTALGVRMHALTDALGADGINVTELDAAIVEYDNLVTEAHATLEKLAVSLADSIAIDCVADPSGFQATLSAVKEQRLEAITASQAVQEYAKTDISTILQSIRSSFSGDDQ